MKKTIALLCVFLCVFGLFACNTDSDNEKSKTNSKQSDKEKEDFSIIGTWVIDTVNIDENINQTVLELMASSETDRVLIDKIADKFGMDIFLDSYSLLLNSMSFEFDINNICNSYLKVSGYRKMLTSLIETIYDSYSKMSLEEVAELSNGIDVEEIKQQLKSDNMSWTEYCDKNKKTSIELIEDVYSGQQITKMFGKDLDSDGRIKFSTACYSLKDGALTIIDQTSETMLLCSYEKGLATIDKIIPLNTTQIDDMSETLVIRLFEGLKWKKVSTSKKTNKDYNKDYSNDLISGAESIDELIGILNNNTFVSPNTIYAMTPMVATILTFGEDNCCERNVEIVSQMTCQKINDLIKTSDYSEFLKGARVYVTDYKKLDSDQMDEIKSHQHNDSFGWFDDVEEIWLTVGFATGEFGKEIFEIDTTYNDTDFDSSLGIVKKGGRYYWIYSGIL